jgi:hypothetical protein
MRIYLAQIIQKYLYYRMSGYRQNNAAQMPCPVTVLKKTFDEAG